MFLILCMHFFIAYQARITSEIGAIYVNQRVWGIESNFCSYYLENTLSYL